MNTVVFYLRKNQQESEIYHKLIWRYRKALKSAIDDMEFTDEYIDRIKKEKKTEEIKENIIFHLHQLMEISVDCRLVYEWLCVDVPEKKESFFKNIETPEKLEKLLLYTNYHFTTAELKQFDSTLINKLKDDFYERLFGNSECNGLYDDITYLNDSTKDAEYIQRVLGDAYFINSLINHGLYIQLGFLPSNFHKAQKKAATKDGKIIPNFIYIERPVKRYNKQNERTSKINDLKTFYLNVSNQALEDYIKVWHLLDEEDKRKNKTKMYSEMTKEELVECFYKTYKVQDNFLKLLQTKEYDKKITFDGNYRLINNNLLVISYLYNCTKKSDYKLLEALFEKNGLDKYSKSYKTDKIKKFKSFLKENENF